MYIRRVAAVVVTAALGIAPGVASAAASTGSLGGAPVGVVSGTRQFAVVTVGTLGGDATSMRIDVDLPAGASGPAVGETSGVTISGPGGTRVLAAPVVADAGFYHVTVPGPIVSGTTVSVQLPSVTTTAAYGTVVAEIGADAGTSTLVGTRLVGGAATLG